MQSLARVLQVTYDRFFLVNCSAKKTTRQWSNDWIMPQTVCSKQCVQRTTTTTNTCLPVDTVQHTAGPSKPDYWAEWKVNKENATSSEFWDLDTIYRSCLGSSGTRWTIKQCLTDKLFVAILLYKTVFIVAFRQFRWVRTERSITIFFLKWSTTGPDIHWLCGLWLAEWERWTARAYSGTTR